MKKAKRVLSVVLSAMMVTSCFTGISAITASAVDEEFVGADHVIMAGSESLFGTNWNAEDPDNVMTEQADGTYVLVKTATAALGQVQCKYVDHGTWMGGDNVAFMVTGAGDITFTYDPATGTLTATGANVATVSFEVNAVYAVGNGEEGLTWLNGVAWNPAAAVNQMTETSTGVYEITFEDVEEFDNYECKFATNGTWDDSWGIANDATLAYGTWMDAVYNSQTNICVDTTEFESSNVTLKLDLSEFNYDTKLGAKFMVTVADANAPAEFDPTEYVIVAGSESLFGTNWDATSAASEANVMTEQADGTYTLVKTATEALGQVQCKFVDHGTWMAGDNVAFVVTGAGDITFTYDPTAATLTVTGANVGDVTFEVNAVYAVGNGEEGSSWLNGVAWNPAAAANQMTETADGVYEITFTDVEEFDNYECKFATNGTWDDSWGIAEGATLEYNTWMDAVYNSQTNICVEVPADGTDVTLKLDLSDFDYSTKQGAKFMVEMAAAPEIVATLKLAVPNGSLGAWDGAQFYYRAEDGSLTDATILDMTDTGETILVKGSGLKTLSPNYYNVYEVGLTEAQVAAAESCALVGFKNANGSGRTGTKASASILKAPLSGDRYGTVRSIASLQDRIFIFNGCYLPTTVATMRASYKGYWGATGETWNPSYTYIYAPWSGNNDDPAAWDGVEVFYGNDANNLTGFLMGRRDTNIRQSPAAVDNLTTLPSGNWTCFYKKFSIEQINAMDASKIVGFRNKTLTVGGSTAAVAKYDLSKAPNSVNGSYVADKGSMARKAGCKFLITGCSDATNEKNTYTGFWSAG